MITVYSISVFLDLRREAEKNHELEMNLYLNNSHNAVTKILDQKGCSD